MKYLIPIILLLASCSEARKLQKAENRVLANIESVEKVGKVWSDLHPCVPDSVVTVIPGKVDTLMNTVTDTVITVVPNIITKTITRTITKIDTLKISVKDNRLTDILQKENETLKAQNLQYQQASIDFQQKYLDEAKKVNGWRWKAIGTWAALVLAVAGFFAIKFKII